MSFISEQLEQDVAKRFDELLDFNKIVGGVAGKVFEAVDGKLFAMIITAIDKQYGKKLPELYKDAILSLLEAFAYGDYEKLTIDTVEIIDEMFDIPFVDEELEAKFVYANLQVLKQVVLHLVSEQDKE